MKYKDYSVKDLVMDESFRDWVLMEAGKNFEFWENWFHQNPDQQKKAEEARRIIHLIGFKNFHFPEDKIENLWENIDEAVRNEENSPIYNLTDYKPKDTATGKKIKFSSHWKQLAAAVAGFIILAFGYVLFQDTNNNTILYRTDFGETQTLQLPDGSEVTLNANSELHFQKNWNNNSLREVWLDGEAFFKVQKKGAPKKSGGSKFVVHTESLDVEVLGTQFNVNNKHGKTRVVLNEGKLTVNLVKSLSSGKDFLKSMTMEPGEMVEYGRERGQLSIQMVDTEIYTAWRNNQLVLKNTPLEEVAATIEDYYGLQVQVEDSALAKRKITGTVPLDNLEILKKLISETFGVKVQQKNNRLIIEK